MSEQSTKPVSVSQPQSLSKAVKQPSAHRKTPRAGADTWRHCKIVGTLGPASSDAKTFEKLVLAGLNVARLNFSHSDHEQHQANIRMIRQVSQSTGIHIAILQDLQGPKIRCGKLLNGEILLKDGDTYTLRFGKTQTDPDIIPIDYDSLSNDVKIGHRVMMDDGLLLLEVVDFHGQDLKVRVKEGGLLKSRKGVNFPDAKLSMPAMTEKDTQDLLFGVTNKVDYIALSFVQTADDIIHCKKLITALGGDIPVIAKIEMLQAIHNIDAICKVADGLMVARGDLGVEASLERVPSFQKIIIETARKHNRPVIIATQMLESMISNPRATLAEITDVANGVLDGADAVMLSAEMASGKYPVNCIQKMHEIIRDVETWSLKAVREELDWTQEPWQDHEAIAQAACETAESISAKAIICLTLTGSIARSISRRKPRMPIYAISPRAEVVNRMALVWGVTGVTNPLFYNTDVLLQNLPEMLKGIDLVQAGDVVVITAGIPMNTMRPTNMVKVSLIT
jgi:pyruvate kinase